MAIIDSETDNLILHVVYDGAPRSGKTESIRSLGRLLGEEVTTPEERDGRTVYFDWLEYQGGRRLGRPIRCRVIGVPGQSELRGRRAAILATADVVIFVFDSSPERFGASLRQFKSLQKMLSERERSIPIFVQLNKRDVAEVLDPDTIFDNLGAGLKDRHVRTVATTGKGIRETFVLAIGHALRNLEVSGGLYRHVKGEFDTQEVEVSGPAQLLELLKSESAREPEPELELEPDRESEKVVS